MITLHAQEPRCEEQNEALPEGLVATPHTATIKGNEYTYYTYRWPELGEPRLYDTAANPIVVPINGQKYRMTIDTEGSDANTDGDWPIGATVTFEPTDEPETPYDSYDAKVHQDEMRESLVKEIATYEAEDKEDGDGFWKDWIEQHKRTIKRIDEGELVFGHGRFLQVFGQPVFLQSQIFPHHEGQSAYHLATLETGWGDAGNINIMLNLDADGVPVKAWFEASCC